MAGRGRGLGSFHMAMAEEDRDIRFDATNDASRVTVVKRSSTTNRSLCDPMPGQTAHDQIGSSHRSRIVAARMTNQSQGIDSSNNVNIKKRKSFDSDDALASPSSSLIQHLILLPPAAAAGIASSNGKERKFSFKDNDGREEELELHLEPLNAYLRSECAGSSNATSSNNPALANSMLLLDICDGTSSDGAESHGSGSSSGASSTASGTKRSLQDSSIIVDRLKKRKLSHRIRSFLLLRPPGLPLVGTDGAADIQHILRAPSWLKNATSELSRESRMMPEEWMWTGQDTDPKAWIPSNNLERKFAQACRINATVVPSEQASMNSQVQMHSVQLSLDEAEMDVNGEGSSLQPVLVPQRSRGGSAPPIMVAELVPPSSSSLDDAESTSTSQEELAIVSRSPRHSSVPLPLITPSSASLIATESPKPLAVPQSVLKAQLLAVLRKSLGNKASDAPLRMKKFVVWNAWMRRSSRHIAQRGTQGSGSSDEDMVEEKPAASSSSSSSSNTASRRQPVTSPDGDDIEFLDLDEELEEPGDDSTPGTAQAVSNDNNLPQQQQQQQPPAAVYVAPFSAEQIAAIQAVNRNRPTLKPASEVLQPITSIITPPPSPPSRPTYRRSSSAGTPSFSSSAASAAVAQPTARHTTRRSRSPPSASSSATVTPSSGGSSQAASKDYFAKAPSSSSSSAKMQRGHSRSRSASGRSGSSTNSDTPSSSAGSGSGSDSSSTPELTPSSSDGSSSDSSSDLIRTPSPAYNMDLSLPPTAMNSKRKEQVQSSCGYQADTGAEGPPSPKLRPRLYRRATYTS